MTVCIAALSDDGKKVVAGTDIMMTYTVGNNVTYQIENATHKKLRKLTANVAIMGAGVTDNIEVIFNEVKRQTQESDTPQAIMEKVREAYVKFTRQEQERQVLIPAGYDWKTFTEKQKELDPAVVMDIHTKLQKIVVIGDIIVAGYNTETQDCYVAVAAQQGLVYERNALGLACAGEGFSLAHLFMARAQYNKHMTEAEVKKLVENAIKEAGHAPGVGGVSEIVTIPVPA